MTNATPEGADAPRVEVWDLPGLAAEGPASDRREQLQLFGQFVGDWEIVESRNLQDDGRWSISRGEIHWRWILEGRAVQDIWMGYDEEEQRMVPGGTTVRFYDLSIGAWHSVWISPDQSAVRQFVGRLVGDEIVLDGRDGDGTPIRWIFSEIRPNDFRWRGERLDAKESRWSMNEEMRIRRLSPRM